MAEQPTAGHRCIAIAGSYLSGKTTLLEALLHTAGAIPRPGSVKDGTSVGDRSPEARERKMSIEMNIADATYLDEPWTFLDCPGSIEFRQDAQAAMMAADMAVVVCEPEVSKALMLASTMRFLDAHDIPRMLFINKIDTASEPVRDIVEALQAVSSKPLVLRQVPVREDNAATGYVDLVSSRAYKYEPGENSTMIEIPDSVQERNESARQELLEALADFDDALLEQLLEDTVPPTEEVYGHLARDLREGLITPVFFGSAEQNSGIKRLMKALRHEAPDVTATLARKVAPDGEPLLQVIKTLHLPHSGKVSIARVWRGTVRGGMSFGSAKINGFNRMTGQDPEKITEAGPGTVVAMGRMEDVQTGHTLGADGISDAMDWPEPLAPMFSLVAVPEKREDEVKLSTGVARLIEEDPSISREFRDATKESVLHGQGEAHLSILGQKLKNRFNTGISFLRPTTPYQETIRKATQHHARHKKQSGGHGEFGDVHLDIKPLPRGGGLEFSQSISGGSVPRQYIPAVEAGVREYCTEGPLGFPVIDVAVNLFDGQHHTVDSSDMAFRRAGILAMKEALPNCNPVLLEPICAVTVSIPNQYTSNAQGIITKRRGQILGFNPKEGWEGWDEVQAHMPQSELHDLIIDLRSQTMGVGTFDWTFDHMAELSGRLADTVIAQTKGTTE